MVGPFQQLRLLRTLLKIGNQWSGVSIPILSCLKGCWATVAKAWKLNKPSRGTRILFEKLLPSQAGAAAAVEAATLLKPKLHFHHTIQRRIWKETEKKDFSTFSHWLELIFWWKTWIVGASRCSFSLLLQSRKFFLFSNISKYHRD